MPRMNTPVVTSTQSIELPGPPDGLEARARPELLLGLLQDYFAVAERSAAHLVRVRWSDARPRFTLLWPPLALIAMGPPEYESSPQRCAVSLDVLGGWLVDPAASPRLSIALTRRADDLVASVELRDYAPRWVQSAAVRWLYLHSQVPIHEQVGLSYLRQLKHRWLAGTPS